MIVIVVEYMKTHYNPYIRIIAIIVVFAFIFTLACPLHSMAGRQAGLGIAMPARHAENLRPTSENPEVAQAIGDTLGEHTAPAAGSAGGAGMNGAIKAELEQLVEHINGPIYLKQAFEESIGLMEDKDIEDRTNVPWHGFSHSGGNTAIALRGMFNMHDASAESMYLVGIAGMLHDIGYYSRHPELGVIKFGHEERSREFVLNEAGKYGIILNNGQKAIVNLIISMTEMKIRPNVWVELFNAVQRNDAADTIRIIDENGLSMPAGLYTDENWQYWQLVLKYALLGGMILAYLDIHDPRPDAAMRKTDLHNEFQHDIYILKDVKEGLTEAEAKELNNLINMHRNILAEQLQDTHNFLTGFGESRLSVFRPFIFDYIPEDAKQNMKITEIVASKVDERLKAEQKVEDDDIKKLLEETRATVYARADGHEPLSAVGFMVGAADKAVRLNRKVTRRKFFKNATLLLGVTLLPKTGYAQKPDEKQESIYAGAVKQYITGVLQKHIPSYYERVKKGEDPDKVFDEEAGHIFREIMDYSKDMIIAEFASWIKAERKDILGFISAALPEYFKKCGLVFKVDAAIITVGGKQASVANFVLAEIKSSETKNLTIKDFNFEYEIISVGKRVIRDYMGEIEPKLEGILGWTRGKKVYIDEAVMRKNIDGVFDMWPRYEKNANEVEVGYLEKICNDEDKRPELVTRLRVYLIYKSFNGYYQEALKEHPDDKASAEQAFIDKIFKVKLEGTIAHEATHAWLNAYVASKGFKFEQGQLVNNEFGELLSHAREMFACQAGYEYATLAQILSFLKNQQIPIYHNMSKTFAGYLARILIDNKDEFFPDIKPGEKRKEWLLLNALDTENDSAAFKALTVVPSLTADDLNATAEAIFNYVVNSLEESIKKSEEKFPKKFGTLPQASLSNTLLARGYVPADELGNATALIANVVIEKPGVIAAASGADSGVAMNGAQVNAAVVGKNKLVVTDNIEFYLGALRLKREFENVQIIPFKVPVAASKKELDNILKELKNIYNPNEVYIYLNNSVKADDLIAGGIEAKALKGDPKTALQTLEAV